MDWSLRSKWWLVWLSSCGLVYGLAFAGFIPCPAYLPLEGRWTFTPPTGAIAMFWYGKTAVAVVLGTSLSGLVLLFPGKLPHGSVLAKITLLFLISVCGFIVIAQAILGV